jgi:hypothetical protein
MQHLAENVDILLARDHLSAAGAKDRNPGRRGHAPIEARKAFHDIFPRKLFLLHDFANDPRNRLLNHGAHKRMALRLTILQASKLPGIRCIR